MFLSQFSQKLSFSLAENKFVRFSCETGLLLQRERSLICFLPGFKTFCPINRWIANHRLPSRGKCSSMDCCNAFISPEMFFSLSADKLNDGKGC